jgi:outer membrane protein
MQSLLRRAPAAVAAFAACCVTFFASFSVQANGDPLAGLLAPGSAGIGAIGILERSPYRGAGAQFDLLPLYVYEGDYFYLHSTGAGVRLGDSSNGPRFDAFIRRRFEGTPYHNPPSSLNGMAKRDLGVDGGLSAEYGGPWGNAFVEVLRDVSQTSHGTEWRLGYRYATQYRKMGLRPYAILSWRDQGLNDYYYGVRPEEVTAERPAYVAGSGFSPQAGVFATYSLSERWSLIAGGSLRYWSDSIGHSPIVDSRVQWQAFAGFGWNLTPEKKDWVASPPLLVRAYYGGSTDCNLINIIEGGCATVWTKDHTSIAGFEIGRPLIERMNGWRFDVNGWLGVQRHFEDGNQPDFWSFRAYLKPVFYAFPWDEKVRTRVGLGLGFSWAPHIPFSEQRDLTSKNSNTSKLLQTFDPTIDVSVGDLVGRKDWHDTYFGFGVSHRSGIFGASRLYGNVNGGSNYIYMYLEGRFN